MSLWGHTYVDAYVRGRGAIPALFPPLLKTKDIELFPPYLDQVIEKAYKKLRLDALVIQQGRLTESTKGVNKDDLLSMVRYGAEMVFNNTVRAAGDT